MFMKNGSYFSSEANPALAFQASDAAELASRGDSAMTYTLGEGSDSDEEISDAVRFRGQYDISGVVYLEGPHHLSKLTPGRLVEAVWEANQSWQPGRIHSIVPPMAGRGEYAVQYLGTGGALYYLQVHSSPVSPVSI